MRKMMVNFIAAISPHYKRNAPNRQITRADAARIPCCDAINLGITAGGLRTFFATGDNKCCKRRTHLWAARAMHRIFVTDPTVWWGWRAAGTDLAIDRAVAFVKLPLTAVTVIMRT
jgi:hypothetical protein